MSATPSNEKIESEAWFSQVLDEGIFKWMHQEEGGEVKRMLRARDHAGFTIADRLVNMLMKARERGDGADDVKKISEKVGKGAQTLCDEGGAGGARLFVLSAQMKPKPQCGLWIAMHLRHFQVVNSFYKTIEASQLTFTAHVQAYNHLFDGWIKAEEEGQALDWKSFLLCLKAWCIFTKQNISALEQLHDKDVEVCSDQSPLIQGVMHTLVDMMVRAGSEKQYKEVIELLLQHEIVTTSDFSDFSVRVLDSKTKIITHHLCFAGHIIAAFAETNHHGYKDGLTSLLSVCYELNLVPPFVSRERHDERGSDLELTPGCTAIRLFDNPSVRKLLRVIHKHEGLDGFTRPSTNRNDDPLMFSCILQAIVRGIRGDGFHAIEEMIAIFRGKSELAKAFSSPKSVLEYACGISVRNTLGEKIIVGEEMLKLGLFYPGDKEGIQQAIIAQDKVEYMRQVPGHTWWVQDGTLAAAFEAKENGNTQQLLDKTHSTLKDCILNGAFHCLDYLLGEYTKMSPPGQVDAIVYQLILYTIQMQEILDRQNVDHHKLLEVFKTHNIDDASLLRIDGADGHNCVHMAVDKGNIKFIKAFSDTWPEITPTAFTALTNPGFNPADIAIHHGRKHQGVEYQEIVTFFKQNGYGPTGKSDKIDKPIDAKTMEMKQRLQQKLERKKAKKTVSLGRRI